MRHLLPSWSSLALLTPFFAACAVHADVTPPAVSAQVDVNGQAVATADATATATTDGTTTDTYEDTDPSALTDFHTALDSHGTWVEDPTYGTVWVPASGEVGAGYTPYTTAGHWAYDDNNDYVWVSDYDWGWAPYHYGRWVEIDGRGWSWIPGRVYRGAWVNWGADDGYGTVGWSPMAPEFVWRGGVAVNYTYAGSPRWSYVGRGDVFAPNVGTRVMTGAAAASISARVHPLGGSTVTRSGGPPAQSLGLSATQIPRVAPSANGGLAKAQQFGRPSTAVQLGAHPPAHTAVATTSTTPGHTPVAGAASPGVTPGVHGATAGTPTAATAAGAGQVTTGRSLPTTTTGRAQTLTQPGATGQTQIPAQKQPPVQVVQQQPGRKKPTTDPTPVPHQTAPGGGHGGGGGAGGGTCGGRGAPPKNK